MSEAPDKQSSSTAQPVEDTQEAQKGGILPEGWGKEDEPPNPNGTHHYSHVLLSIHSPPYR